MRALGFEYAPKIGIVELAAIRRILSEMPDRLSEAPASVDIIHDVMGPEVELMDAYDGNTPPYC